MGKNQHVVPHDYGWAVRGEGNKKVTSVFDRQSDAIDRGRIIAQNEHSELIIHGEDGKIRDKDSYGNDPVRLRIKNTSR